jgi:L-arabinonolactonase
VIEIELLCRSQDGLGENPIWVEAERSLYWTDHVGPRWIPGEKLPYASSDTVPSIKRLSVATGELSVWTMPEQVGSFGFRIAGGLVAGINSGFCIIDLERGTLERLVDPEENLPSNRFNDGKVDRKGRFWCSTMDTRVSHESAHIYVLDRDRSCRSAAAGYSFVVGNGIAFDRAGTRMYFADTFRKMIYVFDLDLEEGRISNRREFFSTAEHAGLPDGATVDVDGYYWVALVQGGGILRLDPAGRLDRTIDMPIPTPTCVAFGGEDYGTLYVTSQKAFLSPEMLHRYPQTGDVFAIHGLGTRGIPEPGFAG